jgi:hypothetical protein
MSKFVYHGSNISALKLIKPRKSTHRHEWVYATQELATSALFMGKHSDFICQIGIFNGSLYIFERFEGALKYAYQGYSGSIYKLSGENFKSGQTTWSAELVSDRNEPVLEEIMVEDALEFLIKLEKQGKFKIYRYPNKPECAPQDKSDLIEKAAKWTIEVGDSILDQVKKYHPDILEKVMTRVEELRNNKGT